MDKNGIQATRLLFVIVCILSAPSLFAFGKQEAEEVKPLNENWLLCITAFDFSALPPAQRITGDVITRNLVDKLKSVSYRLRVSPEYAYYEGYAWQLSVTAAAQAVANKQKARSEALYLGEADWKYRSSLKTIDKELENLQKELAKKEAEKPLVEREPAFGLVEANNNRNYPECPKPGAERRFCQTQKADAFLTGTVRVFHGRYYIYVRLYTLYTNTYIYEDDVIFSMEDTEEAVEEIAARLSAALSGNKPAQVAVKTDPPESQILINQNYAGRGTALAREHPPGKITIAVAAEGYAPETVETGLLAGELLEADIQLRPLQYTGVEIDIPAANGGVSPPALVYQGALYTGETPYTLRLPLDQLNYIALETPNGETARAVFASPDAAGNKFGLILKTRIPPSSDEQRVNRARRWYYWAWGGTWLTTIAAWVTYGMYNSQNAVMSKSSSPEFFSNTQQIYNISTGAIIAVGVAVAYEIFQMARYLYTATEDAVPIVRPER